MFVRQGLLRPVRRELGPPQLFLELLDPCRRSRIAFRDLEAGRKFFDDPVLGDWFRVGHVGLCVGRLGVVGHVPCCLSSFFGAKLFEL